MSAAYSTLVPVTLRVSSANFGTIGFGTPMILGHTTAFGSRTKTYGSFDEIVEDLGADSAITHIASKIYADISPPTQVVVGRLNLGYNGHSITLAPEILAENYTYRLNVWQAGTIYSVTHLVAEGEDEEDVVDGLIAALDATDYDGTATKTGTGDSAVLVLSEGAGVQPEIIFVELPDMRAFTLTESVTVPTSDDALGAMLTAAAEDNPGWYIAVTPVGAANWTTAVANWTETQAKVFVADTADSGVRTGESANLGEALGALGLNRTALVYSQDTLSKPGARIVGDFANLDPGSYTLNVRALSGVAPTVLTSAEFTQLAENKVSVYRDLGNRLFAFIDGAVGGDLGFIDDTISADWLRFRSQEAYLSLVLASDKIPYTNAGFEQIAMIFRAVVSRAIAQGILSEGTQGSTDDPIPRVVVPTVDVQTPQDRAARIARGFKIVGRFAGAVHILPLEIQLST